METRMTEIQQRLNNISEELADLAMDSLRQALEEGAEKRPEVEKKLTRARRAVDKAAALLS